MARDVLLLVAGAIAGGFTVYVVARSAAIGSSPAGDAGSGAFDAASASGDGAGASNAASGAGGPVAVRVAAYERALAATDVVDIESTIELALAAPRSRARDLEITALLAKLAEIDPRRAVEFAQTAFLDPPFLIQAFAALARADAGAAVAELASVAPAAKQRRVAVALLDVLGHERGLRIIGAALPDEMRAGFELDALVARAETDPAGAIAEASELGSALLRNDLLPRLAAAAVRQSPAAALALGDSIDDYYARVAYQGAALNAWAELDPEAVFAFLESNDPPPLALSEVFMTLARYDGQRLLASVADLPFAVRANARQIVMQSLAERDPEAALAMFATMAPGQQREQMLSTIAQAYGRRDPDLALAWAGSLSPPSPRALQGVLQGIAAVDPNRAIDLVIDQLDSPAMPPAGMPSFIGAGPIGAVQVLASSAGVDFRRLADALLERSDPQSQLLMSSAVMTWAFQDSDTAMDWALANADQLDSNTLRTVAERMANANPDLAVSVLDRIAPSQRTGWIQGLVSQMAQTDIARARSLLERLRGQPGYDEAYGAVAQAMARTDPVGAARMLGEAQSASGALQTVSMIVASEWANRDPAAAARWALTLDDAEHRQAAVTSVATSWAQLDAGEAERWLFGLASGPARDAAADGYVFAAAQAGRFEPRVLEAFSSEQARQQSASRAIVIIGMTDPARAGQLLDRHLTDPAVRSQTEQQLARMSGGGNGVFTSDSRVFFPR